MKPGATLVWIDGERADPNVPHVSAFDRGYTRADGLFETLRVYDGFLACLDRHLARMTRGAAVLGIPVPEYLRGTVTAAASAARKRGWSDAALRISLSRGVGDLTMVTLPDATPSTVVTVTPLPPQPPALYEKGIALHVAAGTRNEQAVTAGLKTLAYAEAVIAFNAARTAGFDDALFLDTEGHISEATTANIFAVRGGRLVTPPLSCGILAGITRALTLELAASHGIPNAEQVLTLEELQSADEAFITSSVRELMPVVRVGTSRIGAGVPGVVYKQLHALFAPAVRRCG